MRERRMVDFGTGGNDMVSMLGNNEALGCWLYMCPCIHSMSFGFNNALLFMMKT
jgi:hypothetical protein